ncbi:hypothetical protein H696_04136 [Fonticula alba]|uniref:Uncharacterized protein n=1 Tax=Fonticula alba TaxID=691883 RepID=A0A058Z631_FONAL|nr:hypothetical protein H696_04136 [Fonticula alba]KCV69730.1 hypothetical protein H696_04136 [Fonticula alba]|eukprot:XP_009496295.1 hypothetical protein H696_04136 [Fonticula alba]
MSSIAVQSVATKVPFAQKVARGARKNLFEVVVSRNPVLGGNINSGGQRVARRGWAGHESFVTLTRVLHRIEENEKDKSLRLCGEAWGVHTWRSATEDLPRAVNGVLKKEWRFYSGLLSPHTETEVAKAIARGALNPSPAVRHMVSLHLRTLIDKNFSPSANDLEQDKRDLAFSASSVKSHQTQVLEGLVAMAARDPAVAASSQAPVKTSGHARTVFANNARVKVLRRKLARKQKRDAKIKRSQSINFKPVYSRSEDKSISK